MSVLSEAQNAPLAAVEVWYNGCRLLPAPLIDWTVEPQFDDSGSRTSDRNRITLTGSVLIVPSGSYEQMFAKQEELRSAFSVDGKDLLILAGAANKTLPSGAVISSGLTPNVVSLNISPDIHVTKFDYSVELDDLVAASGVSGITSSLSNQWSFQEDPDSCVLEVTHSVSAEGEDGEPDKFEQALAAVKPLLGIENLPIQIPFFTQPNFSGLFNATHPSNPIGGPVFEVSHQREETADVANGSYSVVERFTIVSGVPFFFSNKTETYDEDANGVATVSVQGTVQGLGRTVDVPFGADGGRAFERASSGFINVVKPTLASIASGIYQRNKTNIGSGLFVNNPTSLSISENKCRGTVGFSVSYTDDPSANIASGLANITSSVSITEANRLYASHAIPFRRLGNIVQDIKTTTEGTISISVQAQAKNTGNPTADTNRAILESQNELNRLKAVYANEADYQTIRISNINQQNSDKDLSCSATLDFIFTVDLASVPAVGSDISLRSL